MLIDRMKISEIVTSLKAKGKRIVFTNGCFDILHVGHVRYLKEAKALGDILILGLNSDSSVKSLKGSNRPINNESDRAEVLSALKSIDYVVIFDEKSPCELLDRIKPDFHTKGADYTLETLPKEEKDVILKNHINVKFIEFVQGKSTTSTIEKMKHS